jgi:hypothetical protein
MFLHPVNLIPCPLGFLILRPLITLLLAFLKVNAFVYFCANESGAIKANRPDIKSMIKIMRKDNNLIYANKID